MVSQLLSLEKYGKTQVGFVTSKFKKPENPKQQ